jgi:hypothetical protein
MVGYMDAVERMPNGVHPPLAEYLELGITETQRELLHAVHALDLGECDPDCPDADAHKARPRGPFRLQSGTATELAREVLGAEVERLRAGGGGWGGGSPEAMRLVAAIEVLLDNTVAGKRR